MKQDHDAWQMNPQIQNHQVDPSISILGLAIDDQNFQVDADFMRVEINYGDYDGA